LLEFILSLTFRAIFLLLASYLGQELLDLWGVDTTFWKIFLSMFYLSYIIEFLTFKLSFED